MRRLARWTLNALTALSLLMCVATAGFGVRSYWIIEGIIWRYLGDASLGIATGPGRCYFAYSTDPDPNNPPSLQYVHTAVQYPLSEAAPPVIEFAGFGVYNSSTMHTLRLPFWFVLVATGGTGAYLWRRRRVPRVGHCRACGYDLTGNVSGVCPECGMAIVKGTA